MLNWFLTALKGMGIGVANIIPGVSGGTMAVVFGIYEQLIAALGGLASDWRDLQKLRMHVLFLAAIGVGAILGVAVFAWAIDWGLTHHRALTMLFFMGLILGSLPAVIQMSPLSGVSRSAILLISLGVLGVLLLGKRPEAEPLPENTAPIVAATPSAATEEPVNLPLLFASGAAAGAAMIVPGVSGSLIILLLGQYETVIAAVKNLNLPLLITLGAGAVIGVLLFAKLIQIALKYCPRATHALIVGLVGGSILVLFEGFPPGANGIGWGTALFVAGSLLAHTFGAPQKDRKPAS